MTHPRSARLFVALLAGALAAAATAQELAALRLPAPRTEGGMPLRDALKARQSSRTFAPDPLTLQQLSDLLWAANGINRPDSDKRTAPSARNWQEIEIYAVLPEGVFLYQPKDHRLEPVVAGDHRAATGRQPFVATAPVNLVLVADTARMTGAAPADRDAYASADAAFVSQNIYLFCAAEGLATVVRGLVDREALAAVLKLPAHKRVVLAQSVGRPASLPAAAP